MNILSSARRLAVIVACLASHSALAGPHQASLEACRAAAIEAEEDQTRVRLSSLERRGGQYRFWLNLWTTGDDGQQQRKRAYCTAKGRKVLNLVSSQGKWDSASKREVAREVDARSAKF